ncbi:MULTISPECIES: TatD family hydrolase [unclassified Acinetobacter]|uniref:TatD family hydrolase n=1 Tax=unclassified Acinetobacter TaxID=196816 RepID=UPI0019094E97|nr:MULTISPECIES: TatD family hydrolase [unclassified Acinetobacter]MBK0064657.1 TatD family hydrolase [Acinetobacter sp. S55]MBK0067954.1 TatD family hydrolase [Acinetobacter sp. S54]
MRFPLFDTHTHFDVPDFDHDRNQLAHQAKAVGVERLILIGFTESRFSDLMKIQHELNQLQDAPISYLAPGLHPFYIEQHLPAHLERLEQILKQQSCIAIGEIGLDTFLPPHKQADIYQKQKQYFIHQLNLAKQYDKPVLLHIRKAHADVLHILKHQHFKLGGIAHAFSGGIEEAKAFIQLGFKLGITGQITNPNAKKLHRVITEVGLEHLVLETDCPDMTPLCCQESTEYRTRNTPVNLPFVLQGLATSLGMNEETVAAKVWENSLNALKLVQ